MNALNTTTAGISVLLLVAVIGIIILLVKRQKMQLKMQDLEERADRHSIQLTEAQRFEAVGIMAGSIVHNLNNLMSVILGHTRMAIHDIPADSPVQNELDHVVKAGHLAADLLNEISEFSRKAESAHKPTDLASTVRDTLKFMRDILPATIQITEDIPSKCEPVMASPTGVQQVLMNLVSNSVQAIGKAPGLIEISLQSCVIEHWHKASPQDLGPGSYLKLTVRDNGQGIDPKTLERIIGAYFETPPDTSSLGLGLNTVFRILDEHEGMTIPTSQSGKGTSFDIYFPKIAWRVVQDSPLPKPEPAQSETGTTKIPLHLSRTAINQPIIPSNEVPAGKELATILLVDDEEMVARVTTIGLQRLGYRVIKHLDSRKALSDFVQTPEIFDVIITDQIMPHMSGVRLARKIHEVQPTIPVILMTGFRDSFNEQKALEAGISQIVLKPTSHRDLAEMVEKVRLRKKESHF